MHLGEKLLILLELICVTCVWLVHLLQIMSHLLLLCMPDFFIHIGLLQGPLCGYPSVFSSCPCTYPIPHHLDFSSVVKRVLWRGPADSSSLWRRSRDQIILSTFPFHFKFELILSNISSQNLKRNCIISIDHFDKN